MFTWTENLSIRYPFYANICVYRGTCSCSAFISICLPKWSSKPQLFSFGRYCGSGRTLCHYAHYGNRIGEQQLSDGFSLDGRNFLGNQLEACVFITDLSGDYDTSYACSSAALRCACVGRFGGHWAGTGRRKETEAALIFISWTCSRVYRSMRRTKFYRFGCPSYCAASAWWSAPIFAAGVSLNRNDNLYDRRLYWTRDVPTHRTSRWSNSVDPCRAIFSLFTAQTTQIGGFLWP